jgi:hypothetical protein
VRGLKRFVVLLSVVVSALLTNDAFSQSRGDQFPLIATLQSSQITVHCESIDSLGQLDCTPRLEVSAVISGRHLNLRAAGKAKDGYLVLGEYKAKLISDVHKKPYLTQQVYEIQYPDGVTEEFTAYGESK